MSRTWDASTSKQGPEVKKKAWIKGFLAREPPGGIAGHLSAAGINPHIVMKTGPPPRLTPCGVVQWCLGIRVSRPGIRIKPWLPGSTRVGPKYKSHSVWCHGDRGYGMLVKVGYGMVWYLPV